MRGLVLTCSLFCTLPPPLEAPELAPACLALAVDPVAFIFGLEVVLKWARVRAPARARAAGAHRTNSRGEVPRPKAMSAVEINTLEAALLVCYASADVSQISKARAAAEKYVGNPRGVFNGLLCV